MRIIKVAFKEACPVCQHSQELDPFEMTAVCDGCGANWTPSMHSKKENIDQMPFRDSPVPMGYDRQIRE